MLYELGVVVTVALSFAPQTVVAAAGVRDARRLRGRPHRGLRGLRGLAVPVLEGALERSLDLAASMDSRGYGRRGDVPDGRRRAGADGDARSARSAIIVGVFGVLDSGAPFVLGLPMLAVGAVLLVASLRAARSSSTRSRYRPDPWGMPEWLTVAAGVSALGSLIAAGHLGIGGLHPDYSPLVAPATSPASGDRHPRGRDARLRVATTSGRDDPVITFDHVTFTYPDASAPALIDVEPRSRRGRVLPRRRRDGRREVDVAASRERARPALHRRHACSDE